MIAAEGEAAAATGRRREGIPARDCSEPGMVAASLTLLQLRRWARVISARYAAVHCLDREDCQQVAWIAAWQAREAYDNSRGVPLAPWITRQIRLALADFRRNASPWGPGSFVIGSPRGKFAARAYSLDLIAFNDQEERQTLGELLPTPETSPAELLAARDAAAWLLARCGSDAELVRARILEEQPILKLAAAAGLHRSALDQRLRARLARLRELLHQTGAE